MLLLINSESTFMVIMIIILVIMVITIIMMIATFMNNIQLQIDR